MNQAKPVRAFLYTDYSIEPHTHDFYEMNIVLGGKGTHLIENASINVKAGDVFVIPPMTVHAYCDTDKLDVYHVLLLDEFVLENRFEAAGFPGYLQLVEIEPFLRRHSFKDMFLHLSGSQLLQLKMDLSIIEDKGGFDKIETAPLIRHTALKILYLLSAWLYKQTHGTNKSDAEKNDIAIVRALEYIHRNFTEKITIDDLCKITFMSRSTFLRSFNSICGCTPSKYLNDYRCERAVSLLQSEQFSKTGVAHLCGFCDLSHMERALKRGVEETISEEISQIKINTFR